MTLWLNGSGCRFESWANGRSDRPCLSWALLLKLTVRVTMRDWTVRAADHPDMASLFIQTGDPVVAVRAETGHVCQIPAEGQHCSCLILLQYSHKEVLHLKPICYPQAGGIVTHCFSSKPRVFSANRDTNQSGILYSHHGQTRKHSEPLLRMVQYTPLERAQRKAHDWCVWQRSDKTIIGACRMHMFFGQTKALVTP